jgi:hypothetical protein
MGRYWIGFLGGSKRRRRIINVRQLAAIRKKTRESQGLSLFIRATTITIAMQNRIMTNGTLVTGLARFNCTIWYPDTQQVPRNMKFDIQAGTKNMFKAPHRDGPG